MITSAFAFLVHHRPQRFLLPVILILLAACSALSQPTETPSPSPTLTPTNTSIPSPLPSPTPTDTATPAPTATATATPSPTATLSATPTVSPSPTLTPSITALPVLGFVFDNWDVADIPPSIADGLSNPMIAFTSANNRQSIANIATAQPFTGVQTVYFVSPTGTRRRMPVLELISTISLEVFPARPGNALAYVKSDDDPRTSGLYILDLKNGFSARMLPGENPLVQRGFYMPPDWSPDGSRMAIAVATGYDIDIYLAAIDGSSPKNISGKGSYDWWPRWSPDGRYIAFVSDRATCPSWNPSETNFCDALTMPPPSGGQVYLYEVGSGRTRQLSDVHVSEAPSWISASLLAFASGSPFDLRNPQRRIWRADIETGEVREARAAGTAATASYLSDSWSPDGNRVVVQVADSTNEIVLLSATGLALGRDSELDLPRYGMVASWSPDGERIAIGGTAGQCPFGIRVKNLGFGNVASGGPPPTMCDPKYSPDGQYIAFTGVNPSVDGRNDIYIASYNGFGATSLTRDLRGQVKLIGWVGGEP